MAVDRKLISRRISPGRVRPGAEALEPRQLLATIVVNSAGDADGADGGTTLSLRQAIEISNETLAIGSLSPAQAALVSGPLAVPNTIDFAIPGTGPFPITPATVLPAITRPVVIDGYSQPGSHPNTNGPGQARNTVLQIALGPNPNDPFFPSLDFQAGGSTVRGLTIVGGLFLRGPSSLIEGNLIGTDLTGTRAMPESGIGVGVDVVAGGSNTIGGTAAGAGNVISGKGIGIQVGGPGSLIEGNLIGTDITGTRAIPNSDSGLGIGSSSNTIGGTAAGAGNVISGNGAGLQIGGSSNLVEGNLIGTDVAGTRAIPNGGDGIDDVVGSFGTIGGTAAGARNVISGNGRNGLSINNRFIGTTSSILVQGNLIGTDLTGTRAIPNQQDGVLLGGPSDTIGGTAAGAGNIIAFNGGSGVDIPPGNPQLVSMFPTGQGEAISGNAIFANSGLGIDLGNDGVTPNIPGGSPTGPNRLQPYPALLSASPGMVGTVISGTLDAAPSTTFTLEFFSNATPDRSGFGQGQADLGTTTATTDASGHASFTFSTGLVLLRQYVTATATDPSGNTSEFARDLIVEPSTRTTLIGPTSLATTGQPVTFAAVVASTAAGVPTGMVAFGEAGVLLGEAPLDTSGVAVFVTDRLPPGLNVIEAAYLGDSNNALSLSNFVAASVLPSLAFGAPTVTSATALTSTSVKVTFSRPLLVGPAQDRANYAIIGPGGHALAIGPAAYDPATDSVRLTTRRPLRPGRSYRITVDGRRIGGVVDLNGIPLDGKHNGRPGSNFAGTIRLAGHVATDPHPSGPRPRARALRKGH